MTSKLKRSIHNQLDDVLSSPLQPRKLGAQEDSTKELVLRNFDLLPLLKDVLSQCRPHQSHITKLDISFSIASLDVLNTLCSPLENLRTLHAKSCGLNDAPSITVPWPRRLQDLDLSRNELSECPQGITYLLHLVKLNLSGNKIKIVPPALLQIPCLKKCWFVNNPIHNVPKTVCREGVEQMRVFLSVEPHPIPHEARDLHKSSRSESRRRRRASSASSLENCGDLRRYVLHNQGSFESDYESSTQSPYQSSSSLSSVSTDMEFSESSDAEFESNIVEWRVFDIDEIPRDYTQTTERNPLCQVYLPEDCDAEIEIHEVKDLSLHPRLKDNELLITPVVRISPHGLNFTSRPAIIVLSHCTKKTSTQELGLLPICSSTQQFQATKWTGLEDSDCQIFSDCVMFKTFHFSLFAVLASFPYPSLSLDVRPGIGGDLLIPELPGFALHIPNDCVQSLSEQVTVKGTVYYCDRQYRVSDHCTPASACIGIEPHGMEFDRHVEITIPIPDYTAIKSHCPDAKLELWCSQECLQDSIPRNWKQLESIETRLERSENCESHVLRFRTTHFSWYEVLWSMCTIPLQKLRLGANVVYDQLLSRARFIAVRFQAFMSHPHGKCCTFGLAVTVYKFGEPLAVPSNYPLLVADSGTKRMFLRIGELVVRVEGCFTASQDVAENLERSARIMDFTGEDFCERFEFALNLKEGVVLPLQEGQMLGKLRFIQWEESVPIHKSYNLIMVRNSTAKVQN